MKARDPWFETLRRYAGYARRHGIKYNDGRGHEAVIADTLDALLDIAEAAQVVAEMPSAVVDSGAHEKLRAALAKARNSHSDPA